MSLKTKRDLAIETLRRARLVGSLEVPPAEDLARVVTVYNTKLEEWRDRGLVYWPNTNDVTEEIPIAVFDILVDLLVNVIAPQFGQATLSVLDRNAVEDRLLGRLRRHTHMKSSRLPVQADYF